MLGCLAFFGGGSAFMVYTAVHNQAGVIIEGIIRLGPNGATLFYWGIAALAGMFVLLALLLMFHRLVNPQVLMLESDALVLPGRLFQRQPIRIAYREIQDYSEVEMYGQRSLRLSVYGKKFAVQAALFADRDSYDVVKDFLISQVRK
jgi:hypothetical protein